MKANKRQVAVTGIGMVSPLGHDRVTTWQNLLAGESGIDHIQSFDASGFNASVAAEVKNLDLDALLPDRNIRRQTVSFTDFALIAAEEALNDAGIRPTAATSEQWGVVTGSGMMTAQYDYWLRFSAEFAKTGDIDVNKILADPNRFANHHHFAQSLPNSGLALLMQRYGMQGYANVLHTGCASGGQALGLALQAMRRGECDFMLAGGFDSMINPFGLASFCLLRTLSKDKEAPQKASRPFDLTRNGFVLGEGAAFLVLEDWEHARSRGATIYAELAGEGNSLSSYRITDSPLDGDGPIQAMKHALVDAGVTADDVDYINAHGTSTKVSDLSEVNAIKAVFGERAYQLPVSATKSQTGHLIAGAGALEGAFCALALHHGVAPMTKNLTTPDPDCDLDFITDAPRAMNARVAMSDSFGFGGSNCCLVFKNSDYAEPTK